LDKRGEIGSWLRCTLFDRILSMSSGLPLFIFGKPSFRVSPFFRHGIVLMVDTPRTTREILPVLMQMIMSLLGSPEVEQQETASRTLGELCRKNGERIFSELVPILQKAITSTDPRTKEGACLAFADIM